MRKILMIVAAALALGGCRSHKEIAVERLVRTDSIVSKEQRRIDLTVESLMRRIDFSFDTLRISIGRRADGVDSPNETIDIALTNGHLSEHRELRHRAVTESVAKDTASYSLAAVERERERADMGRENGGLAIAGVILLAIGVVWGIRKCFW